MTRKAAWLFLDEDEFLTFSCDDRATVDALLTVVPDTVARHGFAVNARKTCVRDARCGRRIICGVAVDADGVHPTRAAKRRLRAARHQGNVDGVILARKLPPRAIRRDWVPYRILAVRSGHCELLDSQNRRR
jgi:hypothetical protein